MVNRLLERFKEYIKTDQFNAIRIGLASPEKILSLSYGEIKKTETINYRTLKPERDGLFCARIFGPVRDWECICGKYKRMKHRGITCEKCGVEVIEARVRRERMGHIKLVAPVCHIWYLKGVPSYLSLILDLSIKDLERIVYFDAYVVINQGKSPYPARTLLTSADYEKYRQAHPDDREFTAGMGAQALRDILSKIELPTELRELENEYQKTTSLAARHRLMRRMKVIAGFQAANLRPEWMILDVLPVLPPDLRPLVPLEGGRFASSDLNDLYRRVINRNIRLSRLQEIGAPDVILKNEMRMLQESVDCLIDNGRRGQPVRGTNKRPLKSLSEMLRGKQGRFRQNLLGKRVDYSGRSVIVVAPELKINQCGLPKLLAMELFKSHVYAELLERELAPNLRVAKRMVDDSHPAVWDVLEYVATRHPVLLNRAPTLHRLGIQAFYPVLVDGKAIKIHPLVCGAFNADFDGDQMAVHVPLSTKAQAESKELMLSSKNLLSPASGKPVMVPSQDMVLGLHYLTRARCNVPGEGLVFASPDEVVTAYQTQAVDLHARIKVRVNGVIHQTAVGRVILYKALPDNADFSWVNKVMVKKDLTKLVEKVYYQFGDEATIKTLDAIKQLGFGYATYSGSSISMGNLVSVEKKDSILAKTQQKISKIDSAYKKGAITAAERYNKIVALWSSTTADVASALVEQLRLDNEQVYENKNGEMRPFNPIYIAMESGARSTIDQIKQLVGMRGLMAKPNGEIIPNPVISNFKDGLSPIEYFISTHGGRKGQADTALKTANSGYLTRRLVDVAQDVVITTHDCASHEYVVIKELRDAGELLAPISARVYGRVAACDIVDPLTGEKILSQGHIIDREAIERIRESAVSEVAVRSPLSCKAKRGICAQCYGLDLSRDFIVDIGTTVGIIAAQSIGEPGTQLTMRTFHIGGTANVGGDASYTSMHDGVIKLQDVRFVELEDGSCRVLSRKSRVMVMSPDGRELERYDVEYGSTLLVANDQEVKAGTRLVEWDQNNNVIMTEFAGRVTFNDLIPNITVREQYDNETGRLTRLVFNHKSDKHQPAISIVDASGTEIAQYYIPAGAYLAVEDGMQIAAGEILVKIPRDMSRTKDITGGLPRIAELFEARTAKDGAILAEISGEVVFGGLYRGQRKITIVNEDESAEYFIPRGKQLNVLNGEYVNAGDQLSSGSPVLHDILRISGPNALQRYLVDQIQGIYRLQGVDINDRHIEIIVRQMLRKVRIVEPGDTNFLIGDRVDAMHVAAVNEALEAEGRRPAQVKPVLMGITLASLGTESFISAASFQETTRILAEAATSGAVDHLYGLKENVIIGKLIPAGTGVKKFREKYIDADKA